MSNFTIQRQKATCQIFREQFGIQMAIIRGGTFMMGSPEDEPERADAEGPQHQVTLSSFSTSPVLIMRS